MSSSSQTKVLSLFPFHALITRLSHADGGFHERLNRQQAPILTGQRRILSQARMVYVAARFGLASKDQESIQIAQGGGQAMLRYWSGPESGSYAFSRLDGGGREQTLDFYAHAFVIFAFSWLAHASGEKRFANHANETLAFLQRAMRSPQGGFVETIGGTSLPRRQNPHMHLLEALLAMLRQGHGGIAMANVRREALAIIELFETRFLQPDGTLREYFTEDWQLDPERGAIIEVGHHFEWAWLLCEAAELLDMPKLRERAKRLYDWGQQKGWDQVYGGYYDEISTEGAPLRTSKRIWPLCEAIKAGAILGDARATRDLAFLRRHYLDRGIWREHLTRDLALLNQDLPATSLYHLLFALTEYATNEIKE